MQPNKDEYSAEELRFLAMLENHHKMGLDIANGILRSSPSPDIYELAVKTIQSLNYMMREINNITS
jgi:uncharacterized protein (DUF305 family)